MKEKFYVTAQVTAHQDKVKQVAELLSELATHSIAESGCIQYQILQSWDQANVFMTYETWESREAEQMHWEMDHLKLTLAKLTPLLSTEAVIKQYSDLH
ncbi:putative quinol monooxygenase [uncultured Shewanella sp.]|uniref:putative quinol monooxygenase n=1 Tax=uncultured Shewanella sp. TaxID=173975 RepID=UPI0026240F33|nr:putative quinol monooxygenase [uncultured Shewanella sp.]